jgi:hypothetical protein
MNCSGQWGSNSKGRSMTAVDTNITCETVVNETCVNHVNRRCPYTNTSFTNVYAMAE